ncbi:YidC/Oxa1 family membrane protein insertase, partial [Anaerotruncus colihominis]|uniref:YidC/Oxa1 family membrane protein insertase n=1 Tax=Anaerotruncus colihominis TaxID=169435 RepID=UPI0039954F1E
MSLIYTIFGYPLGWIMWACFKILPIYGVALVLFTLIVRVCLVPLSIKQQKSMVKMQIFRPRMEEIQKKYANNREKMNEEMMKLYEEEHYNPASG